MSDIKFCACSIIDLQGFSQHLELGANDVRTNIGEEAIKRLDHLSTALEIIEKEKKEYPQFYPNSFFITRINDALILNIDLPADLMPDIGKQIKEGYSANDLLEKFDADDFNSPSELEQFIQKKYQENILDLQKFVGLVSRAHHFINNLEDESYFPGVKTVISLGQRKPFIKNGIDDHISANFAFSNAFKAGEKLSGSHFFVDNNILKLLSVSNPSKNLANISVHQKIAADTISLFDEEKETKYEMTSLQSLMLFRKNFNFRKINPFYLESLQLIGPLKGFSKKKNSNAQPHFKELYEFLTDEELELDFSNYFGKDSPMIFRFPLDVPIQMSYELLTQENSPVLEKRRKEELEQTGMHSSKKGS